MNQCSKNRFEIFRDSWSNWNEQMRVNTFSSEYIRWYELRKKAISKAQVHRLRFSLHQWPSQYQCARFTASSCSRANSTCAVEEGEMSVACVAAPLISSIFFYRRIYFSSLIRNISLTPFNILSFFLSFFLRLTNRIFHFVYSDFYFLFLMNFNLSSLFFFSFNMSNICV